MISNKLLNLNLEHTELLMRDDGIIQINATDQTYNVADIKAIHNSISDLSDNKKALLLLIGSNYTSIDADAKEFLSSPEAGLHSIAEAYVIKSLAQRLLLNFIIKVKGTSVPSKFFTDTNTAITWLSQFKTNNLYNK